MGFKTTFHKTTGAIFCSLIFAGLFAATPGCGRVSVAISTITPQQGSTQGGTVCTITGHSFSSAGTTSVYFGSCEAFSVEVIDASTISCVAPAHQAGKVSIRVSNDIGSGTLKSSFTFQSSPQILSVTPATGPVSGDTAVTIRGTALTGMTEVTFDDIRATEVVVVDDETMTCLTPAHSAGTVDVTVAGDPGSDTLNDGYTYMAVTVSSVTPAEDNVAGGTSCVITGADFTYSSDTTVTFGGVEAVNVVVVDSETITCETPPNAAGVVDLVVTNSSGTGILQEGFTYHNLEQVFPESGALAGGTLIAIQGSDFTTSEDTIVRIGGVDALEITVVDPATITCLTPPADEAGTVDVYVENSIGKDSLINGFTYCNPPSISGIASEHGAAAGGTACTITGNDFTSSEDTAVLFDGTPATQVVVLSSTELTCVTPAHAAGTVDVEVENSYGSDVLVNGFTFHAAPTLASVSPDWGYMEGGTLVTLTGEHFTSVGTTTVTFGGIEATDLAVVSSSQVTCRTPLHDAGPVDVKIANDFGEDILENGFTYTTRTYPPEITSLSPEHGGTSGGTLVTLTGDHFTGGGTVEVAFGGTPASDVTVVSSTEITCTTPAHSAGAVDVTVANDFGSDTLSNGFTYHASPDLVSLSPDNGPTSGGTPVILTGTGFTGVGTTTVTFDGTPATNVNVVSSTQITCTTPAHAAGAVDVTVTNYFGSDTLPGGFTYNNAPDVTNVTPADGSTSGGTSVTVTGTDFTGGGAVTVTFGTTPATNVNVVSSTQITCTTPAHAAGAVDVTVANDFGSDTLSSGFTYNNAPSVTNVTPADGSTSGGTPVTLTGTDFTGVGTTTVTFGTTPATNVNVVSSTQITCTTPSHAAGAVDVTVANSNGSGTLSNGFTYHASPDLVSINPAGGPTSGGTSVTLTGTDFTTVGTTTVTFDGTPATNVNVVSSTQITCTTPAHAAGAVDVTVANDFGSDTLSSGFTYSDDDPSISGLNLSRSGNSITLTWQLDDPQSQIDSIVIYRGNTAIASIGGSSLAHNFNEPDFGYFRYTVGIMVSGTKIDQEDVLIHLGFLSWNMPSMFVDGICIYVAEANGDPQSALPYDNPQNYSLDVGISTYITLETLYNNALIEGGKSYYIAASSYLIASPTYYFSQLSDALEFDFEVAIDVP